MRLRQRLRLLLAVLTLTSSTIAAAQVPPPAPAGGLTLKNYVWFKNNLGDSFKLYLTGLGDAYAFANNFNEHRKQAVLFCPNLALNGHNYAAIMEDEVRRTSMPPETPLSMIMLGGLIKTFPCK